MSDRPKLANLVDGHIDDLLRSGLSKDTIITAGFYSAPGERCSAVLGYGVGSGMVIPYPPNGGPPYARVKLDKPGADGKKYRSPKARGNHLYTPPTLDPKLLADETTPLYITEGEKKALKAVQEGLPCIALSGVWSWRQKIGTSKRTHPIPDLDRITWKDRIVYVVFDSDLATNDDVRHAELELARELIRRGAKVWAIRLPPGPEGRKVGLDDYLVQEGVEPFCQIEPVIVVPVPMERERLHAVVLSAVQASAPNWVWPGRFARGVPTVIFGDMETCKTTFDIAVQARLTTGHPMPFMTERREPGVCVVLSLEDDDAITVKPRLVAAGGDPERVIVLKGIINPEGRRVRSVELGRDLEKIRTACYERKAVHLTISPVSAYFGHAVNSWKDSDIRAVIDPLLDMARELKLSGSLIGHPNKNSAQKAIYRMSGSQAFLNASRLALVTGYDPQDSTRERLVIVQAKRSLGVPMPPLAFHKVVQDYTIDGHVMSVVTLDFDLDADLDARIYTADFLLADHSTDPEEQSELDQAKAFLIARLGTAGEWVASKDLEAEAKRLLIAKKTLYRARKQLKVQAKQDPPGSGPWFVRFGPQRHPVNQDRRRQE